jgi:hypothetical protein
MLRTLAALTAVLIVGPIQVDPPTVSVWYRGTPAGQPVAEELAVIRALGFGGVAWPADQAKGLPRLEAVAAATGLRVIVSDPPATLQSGDLLEPGSRLDLKVTGDNAAAVTPMAWRAIAHGATSVTFDSGESTGAGLENPDRSLKTWARLAIDLARQFDANGRLIASLRRGPGVLVAPETRALDVVLLDAGRSWVLVATNTSDAPVTASVRLPAGTPYAIWLNLLDASMLSMNGEAAGPHWSLRLAPYQARVYLIDKIMK